MSDVRCKAAASAAGDHQRRADDRPWPSGGHTVAGGGVPAVVIGQQCFQLFQRICKVGVQQPLPIIGLVAWWITFRFRKEKNTRGRASQSGRPTMLCNPCLTADHTPIPSPVLHSTGPTPESASMHSMHLLLFRTNVVFEKKKKKRIPEPRS